MDKTSLLQYVAIAHHNPKIAMEALYDWADDLVANGEDAKPYMYYVKVHDEGSEQFVKYGNQTMNNYQSVQKRFHKAA